MAGDNTAPVAEVLRPPLPLPMDARTWKAIARELRLSARHVRIVALLLRGMRDKQIARAMGLRLSTLRTHLSRIFARVGVQDRVELILRIFALAQRRARKARCRDDCYQK